MYLNSTFSYLTDNREPFKRASLTVFFFAISYALVLYNEIYALFLTWDSGFLTRIPLIFWPVLTLVILSGISYCVLTTSKAGISAVLTIVFITVNYAQYLFFNFTGGDSAGEITRWYSIRNVASFSPELFTYFQWPLHFTFFQIYEKTLGLPLIDFIRVSYISLYVLFAIAVFYFTFKHAPDDVYWIASAAYIIFMTVFLNNQLVPQLFGLVVLIFLFGIEKESDRKSVSIQIFLCTVLFLSHPFFFVFYLFSISIFPFVSVLQTQLSKHGKPSDPVYVSLRKTIMKPYVSTRGVISGGARKFVGDTLQKLVLLLGIYVLLLQFQFPNFQQKFYNEFTGSISPHGSGSLFARLPGIIFSDASATSSGPETVLLYQLSSEFVHTISIYSILAIMAALLLVALVSFLRTKTENMPLYSIGIAAAGAIYYVGGFFFPIIGPRAYQIIFLPVGVFALGKHLNRKVAKAIILIALVASPIIGVNIIINASIAGGGNTQNPHAHEAGHHLAQYNSGSSEVTLKYPHAGLPPEFNYQQNQNITTVEEIILQGEKVQSQSRDPSLLVYGPRQVHVASHYSHECNFKPAKRNAIYDNNVTILADSHSVSGVRCVGSS